MIRLGTIEEKVKLMENVMQPWVENKQEEQSRRIQERLDSFEQRITR